MEILTIFWMAHCKGFVPKLEVSTNILLPSIASDMLMSTMFGSTASNGCLESAIEHPPGFTVPENFLEAQGRFLPRVYLSRLEELEPRLNMPFVSQCAYEWSLNEAQYPHAPVHGSLHHFYPTPPEGFLVPSVTRATMRMLSAVLRTLAVAVRYWGLPRKVADFLARETLPVDPTLAFLRPSRPKWLSGILPGQGIISDNVQPHLEQIVGQLRQQEPKMELLALTTPLRVSDSEICELEVVRWAQFEPTDIDAEALQRHANQAFWTGRFGQCATSGMELETRLPVVPAKIATDPVTNAIPLAAVFNVDRLGYTQHDLQPKKLFYPLTTRGQALSVTPDEGRLQIKSGTELVAKVEYWNAGWTPAHPKQVGAFCGTALLAQHDALPDLLDCAPSRYFYLWTLTRLSRPGSYGDFTSAITHGVWIFN